MIAFVAYAEFVAILTTLGAPQYKILALAPDSLVEEAEADGVNILGDVVGAVEPFLGDPRPTAWFDGKLIEIGLLPGCLDGSAEAVNHLREVVGTCNSHGFHWAKGTLVDIGLLPGATNTFVYDINDSGQVTGYSGDNVDTDPPYHAFIWQDGHFTDLDLPDGYWLSYGAGINNLGHVVGYGYPIDSVDFFALLYRDGEWTELGTMPLHDRSRSFEINDLGQIVGWSRDLEGNTHAVIWEDGEIVELPGTEPFYESEAWSIGNTGQIIGVVYGTELYGSCLWSDGALYMMIDVIPPDSGWQSVTAFDISDNGYITGSGNTINDEDRAFLMIPIEQPCEGDANGDKMVDPLDAGYVLARFDCPVNTGDPECDAADANQDLVVDPLDVGYVLSRFGACS